MTLDEERLILVLKIPQVPYKIGITGTIASGKSWVGKVLKEAGVPVLDTDDVVASLYVEDTALKGQIADAFGKQVLNAEGNVDRGVLKNIVFRDQGRMSVLEKLVHPVVRQKVKEFFEDQKYLSPLRAVLVPKLFEGQTENLYNEVWTVVVRPEEELIRRLRARANIDEAEARRRLAAQWSQEQKMAAVHPKHRVIDNSGSPEDTKALVLRVLKEIQGAIPV